MLQGLTSEVFRLRHTYNNYRVPSIVWRPCHIDIQKYRREICEENKDFPTANVLEELMDETERR
jgi:hypothetical protein